MLPYYRMQGQGVRENALRALSFCGAVFCVLLAFGAPALLQGASIEIASVTVPPGFATQVPVSIDAPSGASALNLRVQYNPAVVVFEGVSVGPLMRGNHLVEHHQPVSGECHVAVFSARPDASFLAPKGIVCYLDFQAVGSVGASSAIAFLADTPGFPVVPASGLSDGSGARVAHSRLNGGVSVAQGHYIAVASNPGIGGSVSGGGVYSNNSPVLVEAVANIAGGYGFVSWSEGGIVVSSDAAYSFSATGDRSLTANFSLSQYTLNYAAGPGGSILGNSHQTVFHGGNGSAVSALPHANHEFFQWSDGRLGATRQDTGVTSALDVTALFTALGSGVGELQTCSVESDSQVFLGMSNFAVGGDWGAWLDEPGGGALEYDLPSEQWIGFYLYDYSTGDWEQALYVFKN